MFHFFCSKNTFGFCLLLATFLAGSCSSGKSLKGDTFVSKDTTYKIAAPSEAWKRVDIRDTDLAWVHEDKIGSLLMNSECESVDDAPLLALTNHLLFGMTEREIISQEKTRVSRREGLRTRVKAKLDGVYRMLEILVVKKDGCVYDLVLEGNPQDFETLLPAFENFNQRFDILPRKRS